MFTSSVHTLLLKRTDLAEIWTRCINVDSVHFYRWPEGPQELFEALATLPQLSELCFSRCWDIHGESLEKCTNLKRLHIFASQAVSLDTEYLPRGCEIVIENII